MIKENNKFDGEKTYIYQPLKPEEAEKRFNRLVSLFKEFAKENEINISKVEFDYKLINEINIRIDKRKDYYIIFHKETHLSEIRKSALIAFWILKFKPFLISSENGSDYNLNINCGFAAYIILGAVSEWIEKEYQGKKKLKITEEYVNKLQYALKYWDLSKEALMLITETLCGWTADKEEE